VPWKRADSGFLFELRYAAEISQLKPLPEYEFRSGFDESSIDFRIQTSEADWRVELLSTMTSEAVEEATQHEGDFFSTVLGSDLEDPRHSMAGEMILLQQKIGEKVWRKDRAIKFGVPTAGVFQAIIADVRGAGLALMDDWDFLQIAYGPQGIAHAKHPVGQYFRMKDGSRKPVSGLFDPSNVQRYTKAFRERIHFVGFCSDETYELGSVHKNLVMIPNPHMFQTWEEIDDAVSTFPVPGIRALTV